jgi:chemotaxis response regulator CheB
MHRAPRFPGNATLTAVEEGKAPVRVLMCDDSPTQAAGFRRFLERGCEIEVVAVHDLVESAIAAIPELMPDLVTIDVELHGMGN